VAVHVHAQEVIDSIETTLLIARGRVQLMRRKYLGQIIRSEPQNITARMMKGNVLLELCTHTTNTKPSAHNPTG
jgi:hypothetical protein